MKTGTFAAVVLSVAGLAMSTISIASGKEPKEPVQTSVHFEGAKITGVAASDIFKVELVKSDRTKAVVEVTARLAPYVKIENRDGVVHVWLDKLPFRLEIPTCRLTLSLPAVEKISLEDVATLTSGDRFEGSLLDIRLSDASRATLEEVRFDLLDGHFADASRFKITDARIERSLLVLTDAARVRLSGSGLSSEWSCADASRLVADQFTVQDARVSTSDVASARVRVIGSLQSHTSDLSTVRAL